MLNILAKIKFINPSSLNLLKGWTNHNIFFPSWRPFNEFREDGGMELFFLICFSSFLFCSFTILIPTQKPIVVIIPSYNNVQWCVKNIESVLTQNYSNYRVIYIDDCST